MATNGISSGKAPRAKRRGERPAIAAVATFAGDRIAEHDNGERGTLTSIQAEPIAGITTSQRVDLMRQAGVRVRRGRTV